MNSKRIALYSFLPLSIGRDIIEGVINYRTNTAHCNWEFPIISGELPNIVSLKKHKIDGIIAPVRRQSHNLFTELNIPIINISENQKSPNFPTVTFNNVEIGKTAAESLIKCGFNNFYYLCGHNQIFYSRQRYHGFKEFLKSKKLKCNIITAPISKIQNEVNGVLVSSSIGKIVDKISLPAAIYAENDILAYALLNECKQRGIKVPYELAVIGTDNDNIFCKLSTPELSSINTNAELVGFEAAATLDKLINGEKVEPKMLISGASPINRGSTKIVTTNDSVKSAISYIQNNATKPITVDDIVETASMSRRNLELQFKRQTNLTIHNFITNERLTISAKLLRETQWPLKRVAQESGFGSINRFMNLFKKQYGITPGKYRSASKGS